ncbi:MAG: hypothetical protein LQ338_002301 [Usnochroma carphineum]|nr:MAG: hypothetical protein LQ338_002301 [Usnochroma carphineum]
MGQELKFHAAWSRKLPVVRAKREEHDRLAGKVEKPYAAVANNTKEFETDIHIPNKEDEQREKTSSRDTAARSKDKEKAVQEVDEKRANGSRSPRQYNIHRRQRTYSPTSLRFRAPRPRKEARQAKDTVVEEQASTKGLSGKSETLATTSRATTSQHEPSYQPTGAVAKLEAEFVNLFTATPMINKSDDLAGLLKLLWRNDYVNEEFPADKTESYEKTKDHLPVQSASSPAQRETRKFHHPSALRRHLKGKGVKEHA